MEGSRDPLENVCLRSLYAFFVSGAHYLCGIIMLTTREIFLFACGLAGIFLLKCVAHSRMVAILRTSNILWHACVWQRNSLVFIGWFNQYWNTLLISANRKCLLENEGSLGIICYILYPMIYAQEFQGHLMAEWEAIFDNRRTVLVRVGMLPLKVIPPYLFWKETYRLL